MIVGEQGQVLLMDKIETSGHKRLLSNTIAVYAMRFAMYVFPLITTPFLTRVLHENNYGIYSWTNAIISYARLFIDFGFVVYGVEAIALCRESKEECGKIVGLIIKYKAILCLMTGVALSVLCMIRNDFREYTIMLFISFLPGIVSVFNIDYLFQGLEKMQYITARIVVTKAIFTGMVLVFIRRPEQYLLIPIFTAVSDCLSVLLMFKNMRDMGIKPQKTCLIEGINILKKSSWFFYSRISGAVYSYGNTILIGMSFSKADVAQYNIAYTLMVILQNLITPLSESLYPYMVKNHDFKLLKRLIIIFEPIIVLGCIIAFILAPWGIPFVFGAEYTTAPSIFRVMLLMVIIALPEYLMGFPTLSALGKFKEPNIAVIIAGSMHVIGLCLIYYMGMISIVNIVLLTFITELLVMVIRGYFVYIAKKELVNKSEIV